MNHFNVIRKAVAKAYPQRSNEFHGTETVLIYERVKKEATTDAKSAAVEHELKNLKEIATTHKAETMMYFIKASQSAKAKPSQADAGDTGTMKPEEQVTHCDVNDNNSDLQQKQQPQPRKGNPE